MGLIFCGMCDSDDKLKPFGICINGATGGFSRLMIWLNAYSTNSNPNIIAGYFIAEAERRMGTAARICTDLGTENGRDAEVLTMEYGPPPHQ